MDSIPDGIRTRNLKIRSLAPYPLGHGDFSSYTYESKLMTTPTGFEPVRAEPNGLAGRRLNHSAKVSMNECNEYTITIEFSSATGNRTPGICVTGRDVTNYTIAEC